MEFNYEEAFTKLARKVANKPEYLKHLEKALDPTLYRGLLVWIELDKAENLLNNTKGLNVNDPVDNRRLSDSITRVKSIHEQAEAEISAIASGNKK